MNRRMSQTPCLPPEENPSQQKSHSHHELSTLTSLIAHDFGNLVTLIHGHADLLVKNSQLDDLSQEDARAIRRAAKRAKHLVSRWVDFHHPRPLHAETVQLYPLFEEIATLARPILGHSIRLCSEVEPLQLSVLADREHLERCLLNLIINAKDAISAEGQISLRARGCDWNGREQAGVLLSVEDDGPGIPASLLDKIFDPFFTTKSHGSGLGLPTVRQFVEQSRGDLEIETGAQTGTCFHLTLPRSTSPALDSRPSEYPEAAHGETILLVQPDLDLGRLLEQTLQSVGYSVLWAAGAGDALLVAERYEGLIDAALIDADLAWMSHQELAQTLRTIRPHIALVLLSSHALPPSPWIDRVVAKPFESSHLCQVLESVLQEDFHEGRTSQTRIRTTRTWSEIPPSDDYSALYAYSKRST